MATNKGGRPPIVINWQIFDALCGVQATLTELAGHFGCSEDTIERAVQRDHGMGFAEYFAQKRGKGLLSLRRKQFALALGGDRTMLIWLGKQHLGQREPIAITGADGGPVKHQDVPASAEERAAAVEDLMKKAEERRADMRKRGVAR